MPIANDFKVSHGFDFGDISPLSILRCLPSLTVARFRTTPSTNFAAKSANSFNELQQQLLELTKKLGLNEKKGS